MFEYLVFGPASWGRAPKSLGISWVTAVSFAPMRRCWVTSWMASGCGLVTWKTKSWLELGTFSPIQQERVRGWRLSSWSIPPMWWSLCKHAQGVGFRQLLKARGERVVYIQATGTGAPVLKTPLDLAPLSLSGCSLFLYPLLFNYFKFLVEYSWFTMVRWFLLYGKVNQLHIHKYPLFF